MKGQQLMTSFRLPGGPRLTGFGGYTSVGVSYGIEFASLQRI